MGFPPSIETFVLMHDPYYRILSGSKKGGSGSVCSFWWLLDVLERGVVRNFLSFILTNSQPGLACSNRLRPTTLKEGSQCKTLLSPRGVRIFARMG